MRYRHMTLKLKAVILFLLAGTTVSFAQDTLPGFSALTRGNDKVIISWTNNYPVTTQISIQRSKDSTKNFKTILTVPDPKVLQNGFVDSKADTRSEEHTSELQSQSNLVCRLLLEKK